MSKLLFQNFISYLILGIWIRRRRSWKRKTSSCSNCTQVTGSGKWLIYVTVVLSSKYQCWYIIIILIGVKLVDPFYKVVLIYISIFIDNSSIAKHSEIDFIIHYFGDLSLYVNIRELQIYLLFFPLNTFFIFKQLKDQSERLTREQQLRLDAEQSKRDQLSGKLYNIYGGTLKRGSRGISSCSYNTAMEC